METFPSPGAVLVLAGGESRRLGRPKAWIEWEGRPLLVGVVDRLRPLSPTIVVVGRAGQSLPETGARRVDDDRSGDGPLAGLAAGLGAIADLEGPDAPVAVSACDHPFADPALFRALAARLGDARVVALRHGGRLHPLQAVWRAGLGTACAEALERGERRVRRVIEAVEARIVDGVDLPDAIDLGRALLNVNDSADLDRARSAASAPDGG